MNYRLYSFVNNIYMSPLQWGIQTAHVATKMMAAAVTQNFDKERIERVMSILRETSDLAKLIEWNKTGPTIIVCQGGNVANLLELAYIFDRLCDKLNLPTCAFYEDQESLGGVITAVGVLLPETFFDAQIVRYTDNSISHFIDTDGKTWTACTPVFELLQIVKTARLA